MAITNIRWDISYYHKGLLLFLYLYSRLGMNLNVREYLL